VRRGIELLRKRNQFLKRLSIEQQINVLNDDIKGYEYMMGTAAESRLNTMDAIAVLKKEQNRSKLRLIHCGK